MAENLRNSRCFLYKYVEPGGQTCQLAAWLPRVQTTFKTILFDEREKDVIGNTAEGCNITISAIA